MRERKQSFMQAAPLLVTLVICGVGFLIFMGIRALVKPDPAQPAASLSSSEPAASNAIDPLNPFTPQTSEPAQTDAPISSDAIPSDTTEAPPETTTEPPTTEPPIQMMSVDDSYFADALFIGDSRTDGLRLFNPVGDAKFYCATSMTIYTIMDSTETFYNYYGLRALLQNMQFGKIYLMFGINELGYDTDGFANKYKEVVDEIRQYQPDALIYIQSILYVTQNHEAKNPIFASDKVKEKNARLMELANGTDIFYLEVNDCLNDGTDHLPSEYTGDGVHLKASYYHLWNEYLHEHAWVTPKHPWPAQ